jgi:hypothetical protein
VKKRRDILKKRKEDNAKRAAEGYTQDGNDPYEKFKTDYPQKHREFMSDKSLIRAWFTAEALYSSCEFFQALFYLIFFYFFTGPFTNILLLCVGEDQ